MVGSLRLEKLTKNTLIDAENLLNELRLVAKQGYAIDNEEFVDGMVAIAVPIKDEFGRYVASLAFHGPLQRLSVEGATLRKDVLLNGAKTMKDILFTET